MVTKVRKAFIPVIVLCLTLSSGELIAQQDTSRVYPEVKFSGLLQPRFEAALTEGVDAVGRPILIDTPAVSEFRTRRAFLRFDVAVQPRVTATIRLGVHEFDNPIRRVLNYAYATYRYNENLNIRVGQQKIHFSGEDMMSAANLHMIDRSYTSNLFGQNNFLATDIGLQVFSNKKAGSNVLNYHVGVFNGTGGNVRIDQTPGKNFTGRLVYNIHPDILIGSGGLYGTSHRKSIYAFSVEALAKPAIGQRGRLTLHSEYMQGINLLLHKLLPETTPDNYTMNGWFVLAKYKYSLNNKHIKAIDFGARYEEFDPTSRLSGSKMTSIVPHLGIYFNPREDVDLKINLVRNTFEQPTNLNRDHTLLWTQMNFKF